MLKAIKIRLYPTETVFDEYEPVVFNVFGNKLFESR